MVRRARDLDLEGDARGERRAEALVSADRASVQESEEDGDDRVATGGEDCGVTGDDGLATTATGGDGATGVVAVATGTRGFGW